MMRKKGGGERREENRWKMEGRMGGMKGEEAGKG